LILRHKAKNSAMNQQLLANLCSQIYRRFPEVSGSRPKVQSRPGDQFLLIFHGSAQAPDGHVLQRTVRVVADSEGKIIKVSTSR